MRGVLSDRSQVLKVESQILTQKQAVPGDRVVLIASVLRRIPVQRDGARVLSVSLVLKPKNWRAVLQGLIKIAEREPVTRFVGVQEACAEIEGA